METPIALTISNAVRASGLSRTTIYEALKRGELTAMKAGRRTLIKYSDLEAFMERLPAYEAGG
jgi:excisionase family DNA binding protein